MALEIQPPRWLDSLSPQAKKQWIRYSNAKPGNTQKWRSRWYVGDAEQISQLRAKYGHDLCMYMCAYRPTDEDFCYFQEAGMEAFVTLEKRFSYDFRYGDYRQRGSRLLDRLWNVTCSEDWVNAQSMPLLVAIDFEGVDSPRGIKEFGMSVLDLASDIPTISTTNHYLRTSIRRRMCLFSDTVNANLKSLPKYIARTLSDLSEDGQRDIVLVGHEMLAERKAFDELGIPIEQLPVTGMVDTACLAKLVNGQRASLSRLLNTLGIEPLPDSLHIAGNDAHYTMLALLALLQKKHEERVPCIDAIIKQPLHQRPRPTKLDDDWEDMLDGSSWDEFILT